MRSTLSGMRCTCVHLAGLLLTLSLATACARSDVAALETSLAPDAMVAEVSTADTTPPEPALHEPAQPEPAQPPTPDAPLASHIEQSDCAAVRAETHCAGLSAQGVVLLGVDTGRACLIPIEAGLRVDSPSGMPFSLAWVDEHLYGCFGGDAVFGALERISLADATVESSERACTSVVSWDGSLLVQRFFEDQLYASFEAFAAMEPSIDATGNTPLGIFASDDELLYGFADGVVVDGAPVRTLLTAQRGGERSDRIQLEGLPTLLSQQLYVRGLDLTADGRIVLVKAGDAPGMDVYDLATRHRLASYAAPAGWLVTGLSCDVP